MSITEAVVFLKKEITDARIQPEKGLGDELFLFSSTLAPVINVDLIVYNNTNQVLLVWRDDPHVGQGWHIPGGCIRFKETIEERIQKTAVDELGSEVLYMPEPVGVYEVFSEGYRTGIKDQNERAHFITLAYICRLKNEIQLTEYMSWFDSLPADLLKLQDFYFKDWKTISNKAKRWNK